MEQKLVNVNGQNSTSDVTKLQRNPRNKKGGNNAKPLSTRQTFLAAYEEHFGNITLACRVAEISRQTFYRWQSSNSRVNLRFRVRLEQIKPKERLMDFIEGAFVKRVQEGSDSLIKLGLERMGRDRGWGDNRSIANSNDSEIATTERAYALFLADNPRITHDEKVEYVLKFAKVGKVDPLELAKRVGVSLDRRNR